MKGVNNIFSNHFGISGFMETWFMLDELYEAIQQIIIVFLTFPSKSPSTPVV